MSFFFRIFVLLFPLRNNVFINEEYLQLSKFHIYFKVNIIHSQIVTVLGIYRSLLKRLATEGPFSTVLHEVVSASMIRG